MKQTGKKRRSPKPATTEETMTFEDAFTVAERAVDGMERGNLSLEESLRMYEEGLRALKQCYAILQQAEKRIEVLGSQLGTVTESGEGPLWTPATSHAGLRDALETVDREEDLPKSVTTEEATGKPGESRPT
jgi:exodeoxyribonuclease VII small subunit